MREALKKFVKDWKTVDQDKLGYLMQYGIVQEVMKIEERKAIRRQMAKRHSSPFQRGTPPKKFNNNNSPRPGMLGAGHVKRNSDLANVAASKIASDSNKKPVPGAPFGQTVTKKILDPLLPSEKISYGRARGGLHES